MSCSRYHHAEECDDGNVASGDGCSTQCVIEPGWSCTDSTPNKCTPLADSEIILPAQGVIRVTPVIGTGSVGWLSLVTTPTPPGMPPPPPPKAALYSLGPNLSNDAISYAGLGAGAVAAAGDTFVCPCGGGGLGPAAGVVVDEEGSLGESAGVYVRDGVDCTWNFPYYADWQARYNLF